MLSRSPTMHMELHYSAGFLGRGWGRRRGLGIGMGEEEEKQQ